MCDDYIYNKYRVMLENYFDRVINIKLKNYEISDKYTFAKDKYSWIQYALNKWECLKYDEYDKILFLDIDLLVNRTAFYDIFNFNTPAFYNIYVDKKCISGSKLKYNLTDDTYDLYLKNSDKYGSINGGICLFKPNKNFYRDYFEYTNKLYKNGVYSIFGSGPDETSLFYYLMKNNVKMYNICVEYIVIPWVNIKNKELLENAKAYNYLSNIKPWTKPKFLTWPEEMLWHDIYDLIPFDTELKKLYRYTLVETFDYFYTLSPNKQKELFNNMLKQKYHLLHQINKSDKKYEKIHDIDINIKSNNDYGILNRTKPLE
jgi:hypothetical protein